MFNKNINFWCVVLFLVVAMIIHHILLGEKIIEGVENTDEGDSDDNINMNNVKSFEFTVKGPPDKVLSMFSTTPVCRD